MVVDFLLAKSALGRWWCYFSSLWNCLDILGIFIETLVFAYYYPVIVPKVEAYFTLNTWYGPWPKRVDVWNKYMGTQQPGMEWILVWAISLYVWVVIFLLRMARVFKHFRIHKGVAVYIRVFAKTFESMQDFLVWFGVVILMLSLTFLLFFSLSGGNVDFIGLGTTINTVGLVTMGFYDYASTYNNGYGFGTADFFVAPMFWLLIFLLVIFGQNIILATVGKAYDECSEEAEGTRSFFHVCALRLRHLCHRRLGAGDDGANGGGRWGGEGPYGAKRPAGDRYRIVREKSDLRKLQQWAAVSNKPMEGFYHYFQDPLVKEDRLTHWLWDHGEAVKCADTTLRQPLEGSWRAGKPIWQDDDWTHPAELIKASTILEMPITKPQLRALFTMLEQCRPLNAVKKYPFLRNSPPLFSWRNSRTQTAEESITQAVDALFDAFKQNEALPAQASTSQQALKRAKASLFFNKRRNLINTTRGIEGDISALRDKVASFVSKLNTMASQQQEMASQQQEMASHLASIYQLLLLQSKTSPDTRAWAAAGHDHRSVSSPNWSDFQARRMVSPRVIAPRRKASKLGVGSLDDDPPPPPENPK